MLQATRQNINFGVLDNSRANSGDYLMNIQRDFKQNSALLGEQHKTELLFI
jgi:hypothetical protein